MKTHTFLLSEGNWVGEGKISFSMADDILDFSAKWHIHPPSDDHIYFTQLLDVSTFDEKMHNAFKLTEVTDSSFVIELENQIVGRVRGTGLIDQNRIAWEFRNTPQAFEGFEIYELQSDGSYKMRAEFSGGEGVRTIVKGVLRPQ